MAARGRGRGAAWHPVLPANWTPLDNANVIKWWNPAEGITIATGVSSWADRVAGTALTQGTGGSQPTLTTSPSGRAALSFDGSDDSLAGSFTWNAGRHLFLACSVDTSVSGTIVDGTSGQYNRIYVNGATTLTTVSSSGGPSATVATNTWMVLDFVVLAGAPWIRIGVNGGAQNTGGTASSPAGGLVLGRYGNGGSNAKVIVADAVCCVGEQSAGDRAQMIDYLKEVVGIA